MEPHSNRGDFANMSALYFMLPVSLLLALIFLVAYIWAVRSGQYEDVATPSMRILTDDPDGGSHPASSVKNEPSNEHDERRNLPIR